MCSEENFSFLHFVEKTRISKVFSGFWLLLPLAWLALLPFHGFSFVIAFAPCRGPSFSLSLSLSFIRQQPKGLLLAFGVAGIVGF